MELISSFLKQSQEAASQAEIYHDCLRRQFRCRLHHSSGY